MTVETFLANFERLADAPNGIPKLRELILQLAVRGKLVPQNQGAEPASEILERIEVGRSELIERGLIRKPKALPKREPDTQRSATPSGWAEVRLGEILTLEYGKGIPKAQRRDGDVPVYGANGVLRFHDWPLVTEPCILVGRKGSAGALNCVYKPCWPSDVTYYAISPQGLDFRFTYILLQSLHLEELAKGIKPGLNRNEAYMLPVGVPPLPEQRRIVAKVDELMALCDELEAKQQKKRTMQISLNRACLHALTSPDGEGQAKAWHRLCDQFDDLYTVPETVAELRQTILQLAVMGRLVPQDPTDEPASELIKRIQAEKQRLIAEGKIRKPKPLPPIGADDIPYALPEGWLWIRVGDCALVRGGKRIPKGMSFSPHPTDHIYIRVTDMQYGSISDSDLRYISEEVFQHISRYTISKDDLYITIAGTIGQAGSVPDRFDGMNLTENAAKLAFRVVDRGYLQLALSSSVVLEQFFDRVRQMAQPKLALKRISSTLLPLPPLTEQKRIVAKVDELMALCDELEAKLQQAQTDADNLLTAIVHQLTSVDAGLESMEDHHGE